MELKSQRKPKFTSLTIKLPEEDLAEIRKQAKKFAKGNVSAWIRYAATKLAPKKEDLV